MSAPQEIEPTHESHATGATILIVDDDELIRWSLRERFGERGHRVIEAETAATAMAHFEGGGADLVLLDYKLPDGDGLSLLDEFKRIDADVPVILMTGYSKLEDAVHAMKHGAYHYLNKPLVLDELELLVRNALEATWLRREVRTRRSSDSQPYSFASIIGESSAMVEFRAHVRKIAASPASMVLLTGESGTGKDLTAKVLHYNSARAGSPFVNITCSALPETLLESELFGHEKGAFTDARQRKKGLFEQAAGGTIYLDEIGEVGAGMQVKLLRFLEDRTFRRVGAVEDTRVDVRIVAATNRDLAENVRLGKFREDLYYRLRVFPIHVPPLRERIGDVPLLVNALVGRFNLEFRKGVRGVEKEAMARLEAHSWPGNVRELRNAVERAMIMAEDTVLRVGDFLALSPAGNTDTLVTLPAAGLDLENLERSLVLQALERTAWSHTAAGKLLGMSRDQVRYRIEKFALERSSF